MSLRSLVCTFAIIGYIVTANNTVGNMTTPEDIKTWIESNLEGAVAEVAGDGRHFSARVICDAFAGRMTIARHRMVYKALGQHMESDIHALALETLTNDEV
jgi:acid stress-induced BolA-like protein IbaG/YrbA